MKCPICGAELDQDTYYNEEREETGYYDFCTKCNYDNYPESLLEKPEE